MRLLNGLVFGLGIGCLTTIFTGAAGEYTMAVGFTGAALVLAESCRLIVWN